MNTRILLLSIPLFLCAFASANAQSDSVLWPFGGPILTQFGFSGKFSDFIWDQRGQRTIDTEQWEDEPIAYDLPLHVTFNWQDGSPTQTGWNLSLPSGSPRETTLNLVIDTARHVIDTLTLINNRGENTTLGGSSYNILTNISYSGDSLFFPDDDLGRHVQYVTEENSGGHGGIDAWDDKLISPVDDFLMNGSNLIIALQSPGTVNYGVVSNWLSKDTVIVLKNMCNVPLIIRSYSFYGPDSAFLFTDTTMHTIPAEDSGTITVRFTPKQVKYYSGGITILTDEPYSNDYKISLVGNADPSSVNTSEATPKALTVIPSVADAYINVQLASNEGSLSISNILGQQIYSNDAALGLNGIISSIDTHSWPNGSYIATFTSRQGSLAAKFIVRH